MSRSRSHRHILVSVTVSSDLVSSRLTRVSIVESFGETLKETFRNTLKKLNKFHFNKLILIKNEITYIKILCKKLELICSYKWIENIIIILLPTIIITKHDVQNNLIIMFCYMSLLILYFQCILKFRRHFFY